MRSHLIAFCLVIEMCTFSSIAANGFEELDAASTPEQIATLTGDADFLVADLISPLSGQICVRQADMFVHGAQSLQLQRFYDAPCVPTQFDPDPHWHHFFLYHRLMTSAHGWRTFPHTHIALKYEQKSGPPSNIKFYVPDPSGVVLTFRIKSFDFRETYHTTLPCAVNNVIQEIPSGKYDLRNMKVFVENHGSQLLVQAPDGTQRYYRCCKHFNPFGENFVPDYYLLEKEILPSGHILRYVHNTRSTRIGVSRPLLAIEALDPKERYVYARIDIQGNPDTGTQHFTSSTGDQATYKYRTEERFIHVQSHYKEKSIPGKRKGTFHFPPLLAKTSTPQYRQEHTTYNNHFLLEEFHGKNQVFKCLYKGPDPQRVEQLLLPTGPNGTYEPIYTFEYDSPIADQKPGSTTVKHKDGSKTIYQFNQRFLPTAIQFYDKQGALKKEKLYTWSPRQWLETITLKDSQNTLYRKSFQYDVYGNPIEEHFSGDLTGDGSFQTHVIRKQFSQDNRQLLLREEDEEGPIFTYAYLPGTHLVTSKLTKDKNEKILSREFFVYDDSHHLVQHISDDGNTPDKDNLSGITQRLITKDILRQQTPFLHLPEWLEECYLEAGQEKLLKKIHFHYDQKGNISQEDIYDANAQLAYSIYKEYNEQGKLLSETNPLGQKVICSYDARGQRIVETPFSQRITKHNTYDLKGRLTEQQERGSDGINHVTTYAYNEYDQPTRKTDYLGNSTLRTFDPIVNKPTSVQSPSILSETEEKKVCATATYDPLGNTLAHCDANGHTTQMRYNAYGSKTAVTYPDSAKETSLYTKDNKLKRHTDPDGLITEYTHDLFGRETSRTYLHNGKKIAQETLVYNAFHLLQETDKEGNITSYAYDGAGRKIREDHHGRVIEFEYDALNRLTAIIRRNGDQTLVTHYERDLLDRILESTETTLGGQLLTKISYTYDEAGNVHITTRYIEDQPATTTRSYDSFNRLIAEHDPLGNLTRKTYSEEIQNALGQRVLQVTTIDAKEVATVDTHDAYHRIVKTEKRNPAGTIIAASEKSYDPLGNLRQFQDHIYLQTAFLETHTTKYTYTARDQVSTLTRAFGTPHERTTHFVYTPSGKLASKTLPNGVTLQRQYDHFGYLSTLTSSDKQIHHLFIRNRLGDVLEARDPVNNVNVQRDIDPFGKVLREVFSTGLVIHKSYDAFNRPLTLQLPDGSTVRYTYDPRFLREVSRVDAHGQLLYTHRYNKYDLRGNLLSETMIGKTGDITRHYDANSCLMRMTAIAYKEERAYDAVGNLITRNANDKQYVYEYDDLAQLTLEKSNQEQHVYAYDSNYNQVQKDDAEAQINALDELSSRSDIRCEHDLNGNTLFKQSSEGIQKFKYDALDQLIQVDTGQQRFHYMYDPFGRRLVKITEREAWDEWEESTRENYLYDGAQEIAAFENGECKQQRILGHEGTPVAFELDKSVYAPIVDPQGHVSRLVNVTTQQAHDYAFSAFGEIPSNSAYLSFNLWNTTPYNPWSFAGKRRDPETNFLYFGLRYYDPQLARWLTTDPAGFADTHNLYTYLRNNPWKYTDPDGRLAFVIPLLVLVFGGAAVETTVVALGTLAAGAAVASICEYAKRHPQHKTVNDLAGLSSVFINHTMTWDSHATPWISGFKRNKQGRIDPTLPEDPFNDPNLEDISHPKGKAKRKYIFKDKRTGEMIEYHEGQPGEPGHKGKSHYHRPNPNSTGKRDEYLDEKRNPVPDQSEASHLYPKPKNVGSFNSTLE